MTAVRPLFVPDGSSDRCSLCSASFSVFLRRHHCRICGLLFCWECVDYWASIPRLGYQDPEPQCHRCYCQENHIQPGKQFYEFGKPDDPPLLMLNGALVPASLLMGAAAKLAEEGHFRVLLLEYPGLGSEPYHAGVLSTASVMARILHVLEECKEERKVAVFGYSMGGYLAMKFAILHPERVSHLLIGGATSPGGEFILKYLIGSTYKILSRRQVWSVCKTSFKVGEPGHMLAKDWEQYKRSGFQFRSWNDCIECMLEPPGREDYYALGLSSRLSCPVVFINGEHDNTRMGEKAFLAKVANSQIKIIPGARHETATNQFWASHMISLIRDVCKKTDSEHVTT